MKHHVFRIGLALAALSAAAHAEQYWVAYEGNDFPENEGWIRTYGDGTFPPSDQPDRSLESGELVISTARNPSLWEYYSRELLDPAPGEMFVAEWRTQTEILFGPYDNSVVFARASSPAHVSFTFRPQGLQIDTDGFLIPVDPSVHHSFSFASENMTSYVLRIDNRVAYEGLFDESTLLRGFAAFGPGVQGAASTTHWDYLRFGVVPEPSTCFAFSVATLGLHLGISKRRSM